MGELGLVAGVISRWRANPVLPLLCVVLESGNYSAIVSRLQEVLLGKKLSARACCGRAAQDP